MIFKVESIFIIHLGLLHNTSDGLLLAEWGHEILLLI